MRFHLTILLLGLVTSAPTISESAEVEDVLDEIIAVYGGEDNLRKLDSVIQEWSLLALAGNRQGTDKRSIRMPDRLKVELTYTDKQETRLLNGDAGLVIFGDRPPAPANDMQKAAMRLQLMRLYSPLALRDRIESLRIDATDGTLILTLTEQDLRTDYVVDTENWHIKKIVGTLSINGAEMSFMTEYSDFSMVEGVLVHHRENKYAGNVNTAVLRLRKIEFDVTFDDEAFKAPGKTDASVIARIDPAY
jgi:hypothetical protein